MTSIFEFLQIRIFESFPYFKNREIFFPKLNDKLHLTAFSEIAVKFLNLKGYEPFECTSEDEARLRSSELIEKKMWPCYFFTSDTTGEKDFEEFFTTDENLNFDQFEDVGVIENKINFDAEKLDSFVEEIDILRLKKNWTKDLLLAVLLKIFSKKKIDIIYYRQMKITRNKKDIYHKFIYRNISKVLVITKQLQKDCQKYLPIPNNKIEHLKYGIEFPDMNNLSNKKSLFKKYNLQEENFIIGIFSRVEEQKGQHLVIEALNIINKFDIQLLIVGHCMDSKYLDRLSIMIKDYNLKDRVSIVPFIESPMEVMPFLDLVILFTQKICNLDHQIM